MREIVVNTGPIIALVAATQSIEWLPTLYDRILIPYEVLLEIEAGGIGNPETLALHGVKDLVTIGGKRLACLLHCCVSWISEKPASYILLSIMVFLPSQSMKKQGDGSLDSTVSKSQVPWES